MELVIVGRHNVGKTLFMINFAAYLGLREIRVQLPDGDGVQRTERLTLERARRDLVSLYAPKTTAIQSLRVDVSLGRQRTTMEVVDTPGMAEGIAEDGGIRHQTALTLERLTSAGLIFHVMDASAVRTRRRDGPGAIDTALTQFGRRRGSYLLVANKMDRPGSHEGFKTLKERNKGLAIVPVSSVTRRGFRDLKVWMMRTLA